MKYQIIRRDTLEELEEAVQAFLTQGWIPTGGVSITYRNQVYTDRNDDIRSDPELICAQAIANPSY